MTTANLITIFRICLVPCFVVAILSYVHSGNELYRLLALLAFGVAAILDGVDGYVARRYNQRSNLGTVLDPLADKLLMVSALLVLSVNHAARLGQIPLWLMCLIIGRDLLLGVGVVAVRLMAGRLVVRPHVTGKIATVFQIAVVLWILLGWDLVLKGTCLAILVAGAGIFTGLSSLFYVWDGLRQLNSTSASAPANKE